MYGACMGAQSVPGVHTDSALLCYCNWKGQRSAAPQFTAGSLCHDSRARLPRLPMPKGMAYKDLLFIYLAGDGVYRALL
jgi:hypothetical protein